MSEKHIAANGAKITVDPTLIIGLGGTGILACQWLYYLMFKLFGRMPPFMRMVAFDSDVQERKGPALVPSSDFINLFDDLYLAAVLRDFQRAPMYHRHLEWLKGLTLDSGLADRGCQGLSRLGRTVFFELHKTIIQKAIESRFDELRYCKDGMDGFSFSSQYECSSSPKVHIVGSICGGTGSGLLLDMAYGVRRWSHSRLLKPADIVGHLVLPEAFEIRSDKINDKLQAVAVSMLEQIEFLSDSRRPDINVSYGTANTETFERAQSPFTFCFLLNGAAPGGGGTRAHLCEMIARTIRVMTVEPAGTAIAGDANNKQTDALRNFDENTGRKHVFSSYGLHIGAPPVIEGDEAILSTVVLPWILETLSDIRLPDPLVIDPTEVQDICEELDAIVDYEGEIAKCDAALSGYSSFRVEDDATQQDRLSGFRQAASAYLLEFRATIKSRVESIDLEQRARRILAGIDDLCQKSLTSAHFDSNAALRKLAACQQALGEMQHKLNFPLLEQVNARLTSSVDSPINALDAIRRQTLETATFSSWINDARDAVRKEYAKAFLGPRIKDLLVHIRKTLQTRLENAKHIAPTAKALKPRTGSSSVYRPQVGHCSTVLYDLQHPRLLGDPTDVMSVRFLESLVYPVVAKYLLDEKMTVTQAGQLLEKKLAELQAEMRNFVQDYQIKQSRIFHVPLSGEEPVQHPFYESIRDVLDRSRARVAIDQAHRYKRTEDVVISQHVKECCAPGLLKGALSGAVTYNSADPIAKNFEELTGNWVTVLQFRYGFCLEALDNFSSYGKARKRYGKDMHFREEDLWLDADWHSSYRDFVFCILRQAEFVLLFERLVADLENAFYSAASLFANDQEKSDTLRLVDEVAPSMALDLQSDRVLVEDLSVLEDKIVKPAMACAEKLFDAISESCSAFAENVRPLFDAYKVDGEKCRKKIEAVAPKSKA